MKCRLLYVVGQLGRGGLERQLFYLIRSMDRERYKPVVAVWSNSSDVHYAQELRALNVPVVFLGEDSTLAGKVRALCGLVSAVRPEVIHSYSFYTNLVASLAAQGTVAIAIGSIRSNFVADREKSGNILGRLCARWPSAQIVNSFTAAQNAKHHAGPFRPRRIHVIRNGIDLDRFSPRGYLEGRYVLAVGSLLPVKRWDRLIRAVSLLSSKGIHIEVLHAGSGPLKGELEMLAKDLQVEHAIRFAGSQDDIPSLLADAAFLVHTSDVEGLPNVVLEAMACSRAVVATDAGEIPHLIDDGQTGFVVPREDEAMLANRMAMLLADRELSCRMGAAGRIRVEQEFGLERLVPETFSAYRAEGWKG